MNEAWIASFNSGGAGAMDHNEAVKTMAAERYLLDELTPDLRDAFEEHLFCCQECALDVSAGTTLVDEMKRQLPGLSAPAPVAEAPRTAVLKPKKPKWSFWGLPAFAAPAFAALLGIIAYQNIATIPGLRTAATQPRVLPWTSAHAGTRAGAHIALTADPKLGAVLLLDLSQDFSYTSYAFDLYDPHNQHFWSQTIASSAIPGSDGGSVSVLIPGAGLQQGSYSLVVTGITAQGERKELDRRFLDVQFNQ